MHRINIREVRERLSTLISEVEHGEEIVITRRGRAVARLTPVKDRPRLPDRTTLRDSLPASTAWGSYMVRPALQGLKCLAERSVAHIYPAFG